MGSYCCSFKISVQCLFCIVFPCPPVKNITFILLANIKLAAPDSNVNFSKSPHGPIFKFLWWFVKWFSENGTNPSTGELFDPYKPLYKPFQQKNKWPDGLFYIGPSVVARLTMTTFFGNSARINKAWQKRVFKNEFKKGKVEMEYLPWRFINIKASLPFLKTPINSECINIALEDWSNDW